MVKKSQNCVRNQIFNFLRDGESNNPRNLSLGNTEEKLVSIPMPGSLEFSLQTLVGNVVMTVFSK